MIDAPYDKDRKYDVVLSKIIKSINMALSDKKDDFLMLCCGSTGSGKSMLMLHVMEEFLKEDGNVKYIGLDKGDFANALKAASVKCHPRLCANDEANISKRESLTKYNRDLIDLYSSIRGMRIFHWWNNPSLDILDKHFIEERIKGVIYISTKDVNRPRVYYYFRKKDLLRIWEKYNNLKLPLLQKVRKKYAYIKGWFKDYDGELLESYNKKKGERMDDKVSTFYDKYGSNQKMLSSTAAGKLLGVNSRTIIKHGNTVLEQGLVEKTEVLQKSTGRWLFSENCLSVIDKLTKEKFKNSKAELDRINNEVET